MGNNGEKALVAVGVAGLLIWGLIGPEGRQKVKTFVGDLVEAMARYAEEEQRRRQLALMQQVPKALPPPAFTLPPPKTASLPLLPPLLVSSQSPPTVNSPLSVIETGKVVPLTEPDTEWRKVVVPPSVVLIVGRRGSGKSALGYRLLELLRYRLSPYVIGVPAEARKVLPDWIGIAPSLEELPHKSIGLVDEAYLHYHARHSMAEQSKAMSQAINLSRQRDQTLIFVSQEARQVDRNIASSANILVFKDLGMLQLEFERPELRKLVGEAKAQFSRLKGDLRPWAYVYSPDADFLGLLKAELPTFWKPSLSRLFSLGEAPAQSRPGGKLTSKEKAARAEQLHAQGQSYAAIASELGVTKATVVNYLKGYPYKSR